MIIVTLDRMIAGAMPINTQKRLDTQIDYIRSFLFMAGYANNLLHMRTTHKVNMWNRNSEPVSVCDNNSLSVPSSSLYSITFT